MKVILAKQKDLNKIKKMYTNIITNMYANNIEIWNDYYPIEVFQEDIDANNMYLVVENEEILGCFVIYEHKDIEHDLEWKDRSAKAFLLNRVGVNVKYLKQGIGKFIVDSACKITKKNGGKYLRLLVSDINIPAINLYLKCDLNKVAGIHEEKVNEELSIFEYGFEKEIV